MNRTYTARGKRSNQHQGQSRGQPVNRDQTDTAEIEKEDDNES